MCIRDRNGIVTRYEFDENDYKALKILKFDSYSEEWLDFILNCRSGKDNTDYDMVIGGVATVAYTHLDVYKRQQIQRNYCAFWKVKNANYYIEEFANELKVQLNKN